MVGQGGGACGSEQVQEPRAAWAPCAHGAPLPCASDAAVPTLAAPPFATPAIAGLAASATEGEPV
jgi:hypothetical protein